MVIIVRLLISFRFSIDEPHGAYRTGTNNAELLNQIDLLGKDEAAKKIIRSLITKVDHTPKMLKSNLKGAERLEEEIKAIYNRLVPYSELREVDLFVQTWHTEETWRNLQKWNRLYRSLIRRKRE